jgi:adenylate kinase family enzyme
MPVLVFLNGPPASGKSTIARLFVESRPLALSLDVDDVRSMLGAWLDNPTAAGLRARSIALAIGARRWVVMAIRACVRSYARLKSSNRVSFDGNRSQNGDSTFGGTLSLQRPVDQTWDQLVSSRTKGEV